MCAYARVYLCALCRRVDDEISRFEKFTSGPRSEPSTIEICIET
ncbi:hypothetical protein PUN28_017696 [Cardiocondyla obscurior]|uniref:Uncharacterized protein n=1 Tax=Cardiocondyla obscurior TaxID=286306 RepID=A0AAW2EK80_9HYME